MELNFVKCGQEGEETKKWARKNCRGVGEPGRIRKGSRWKERGIERCKQIICSLKGRGIEEIKRKVRKFTGLTLRKD